MAKKVQASKPKVAAYCRVSTDKEDQLMSLSAQQSFFEEYAKSNNFELVPLYADEGISGTKLKNRRAFNRMMKDAEEGLFERVYVKDISRFARNAVDFLNSIRKLKAMGIKCQFITSNLSTEDGEFTLGILALMAQEESANLSKRVKFGKERNAKAGKIPNIVYGYDKTIGELFELKINKSEASVVKRIYNMYLNQGYGANKIAWILNKEGLKTKRNCRWSQNAISRILQNELYIGRVINAKEYVEDFLTGIRKKNSEESWFVTERPELAIITQEEFDKAQKLLGERKDAFKAKSERQSCKYPFSTLIKCGCCGYSFRRISRTYVNEYNRWACSGRNANGADFCSNHTLVDERELLDSIREYMASIILNKDKLLQRTISEFKRKYDPGCYEKDEQAVTAELNRLKKAKSKQTQMFEVDAITIEELKERTEELNAAISKCEKELAVLKGNTSAYDRIGDTVKKYCGSIDRLLSAETFDNAMLKRIIDKIVVSTDGEIKVYLKLFADLDIEGSMESL
ncbi:DNA invertase Pin-like site-specific DNA recombinase [Anaerobacterium chartisolvens]|uniref:DNA invertase Pin-like site-specific DNA recombinase n=1 Tax=Anaerobacterium chartisolvens TaxID=1297424 RepID=A0A369AKA9_9FIRM|nr:recombinase family protein [Anaerobacterium chartisolvens]RCX07874.1 DNA invertase Pin-like site-specific DNA recombinase [Anaerobacterium chartisolvens]